ncbi:spermine/spermidine synthase domain-containing protein [Natronospora cellulosivora (SeqCode)]
MKKSRKLTGLLLTSFLLFNYQLLVNRIFSVILSNQYSYLVISFSIMGLGIGGILVYYLSNKKKFSISFFSLAFAITYPLTISIVFFTTYIDSPIWYILMGMIPFIFGGGIISYIYREQDNTYKVYFLDLFGGISGLITAMLLMNLIGTVETIILSYIFLFSLLLILNRQKNLLIFSSIMILLLLVSFNNFVNLYEHNFNSFLSSPAVGFEEDAELKFSNWDSFSRTDVSSVDYLDNELIVALNGRSFSRMVQYNGDLSEVEYLKNRIGYFPLELGNPESVALIGSGGGEEILFSFLAGIEEVTAVEINAGTIEATEELADFTDDIYNDPRVNTIIGDGRSYLRRTENMYDQIYLSLVYTDIGDNIANVLSENYIYTKEAIGDYFEKLNPGGKLSFLMHSRYNLLKLLATTIQYFENEGVPNDELVNHFVILEEENTSMYPLLLIKEEPFSEDEIKNISIKMDEFGLRSYHLPGVVSEKSLHLYSQGELTLDDIVDNAPFNMSPVNDNRPFFYDIHLHLPQTLLAILIASIIIFIIVYLFGLYNIDNSYSKKEFSINFLIFTLLGMGFMLIEIAFIQKFSIFLEHPTMSYVTVVVLILFGAGLVNLLQAKNNIFDNYKPVLVLFIFAVIALFTTNRLIYWNIDAYWLRIILVALILIPMGFLMGIPFPMILRKMQSRDKEVLIPYLWGVNGIGSILGSVLTLIISLKMGFNSSFIIGAILYLIIAFLIYFKNKYIVKAM